MKLHISTHPKFHEVRDMFSSNPETKLADVERQLHISRLTLAGWVYDIREAAGAIIHRGTNRQAPPVKSKHVRRCLKCKQMFDVEENYYRCKRCRG